MMEEPLQGSDLYSVLYCRFPLKQRLLLLRIRISTSRFSERVGLSLRIAVIGEYRQHFH